MAATDGAVGADDPTVDEVTEPSYVETGAMGEDTTDDGWGSSVWDAGSREASDGPPEGEAQEGAQVQYSESTPDLPQAHEQTYPSPTGAPPTAEAEGPPAVSGYTAPTPPQDAPIAQGLYGDYGEFDSGPPPTEEVPSSVMEDVGTAYNAPMNVPEPPPIPGILDRFTPPPVERTGGGGGYSKPKPPSGGPSGVPDYLAGMEDDSGDDDFLPEPPGRKNKKKLVAPPPKASYDRDDDDVGRGPPIGLLLAVLGVGCIAVVAVIGVIFVALSAGGGGGTAGGEKKEGPLEVRQDMNQEPGLIGVEPRPEPKPDPAAPTNPEPETPEPAPDTPAPKPEPAAPTPRPQPSEPRPQPRPAPAAPKPTASVGTLKVDANRRVIIRVNGQPKGFTPQRLELPPGTYEVSAAMPGQADTEKKKTVTISAPGTTVGVDFAF